MFTVAEAKRLTGGGLGYPSKMCKMSTMFHVTYEILTTESIAQCDAAERGFVTKDDGHVELAPHVFGPAAGAIKDNCGLTLREAVKLIGCVETSGTPDFYETDGRDNYRTGEHERRALHCPDSITAASYDRIARLIVAYRAGVCSYER